MKDLNSTVSDYIFYCAFDIFQIFKMRLAIIAIIVILLAFYYYKNVASHEHFETPNNTFFDSMRNKATDYYYDSQGLTLADKALEQKIGGGFQ